MTKRLLVMRHAKSSWDQVGLRDYQRPLNERGLRDAPGMAEFVVQQNCLPQLIASSTAVRARQTAELFVQNYPPDHSVRLELIEEFYHAPPEKYLQYLTQLDKASPDSVMVVGHNPGLEQLVSILSGESLHFPTAAIACFTFEISRWCDLKKSDGKLNSLWRPKEVL